MQVTSVQNNPLDYTYTAYTQKNEKKFSDEVNVLSNDGQKNEITPPSIYEELKEKYDIQNTTFESMKDIANSLYQAGEISGKDVALITFDRGRAARDIARVAKQQSISVAPDFSLYETKANADGQRDWIAEFVARAKKALKYGDLISYNNDQHVLSVLEKLQKNE